MFHAIMRVAYMGLLSLVSIATPVPARAGATTNLNIGEWETAWTKVLTRYVDDSGRIDFDSLRQNHADLDRVVAFIAAVDPDSQPQRFLDKHSRLAFYINAYNALALDGAVPHGVPQSMSGVP